MPQSSTTIHLESPDEGRVLREFLARSGYDMRTLSPLLGQRGMLPLMLHRTQEPSLLNTLVRWFVIGRAVEATVAKEFLPAEILGLLLKTGLLIAQQDKFAPAALLLPFGDVLTACDHAAESDRPPADVVIGPNAPAGNLLHFTVPGKVSNALDLCCGGGILAMKLASHSERVVASDLNPRAMMFARFNARLAGVENIEFLEGDGYSAVAGRRFDLITVNPPFYLLPVTDLLYRDNPMDLDGFARQLLKQAPDYLNEGGLFQMVFEWAEVDGQAWPERLGEWMDGTGCDAWVVRNYVMEPYDYCEARLRSGGLDSLERDLETLHRWSEYYRRHKVKLIHGGLVALRKRSGARNWLEVEPGPVRVREGFGEIVEAFFRAQDVGTASEADLLQRRPRLSPHVRLEHVALASDEGWKSPSLELQMSHGIARSCAVDKQVATFLSNLNGKRSLQELMQFVAPQAGADPAQLQAQCLAVMRQLIRRGFVSVD